MHATGARFQVTGHVAGAYPRPRAESRPQWTSGRAIGFPTQNHFPTFNHPSSLNTRFMPPPPPPLALIFEPALLVPLLRHRKYRAYFSSFCQSLSK